MRKVTVEGGKAPYLTRSKRSSIKQEDGLDLVLPLFFGFERVCFFFLN
jgi:hypothetical protein